MPCFLSIQLCLKSVSSVASNRSFEKSNAECRRELHVSGNFGSLLNAACFSEMRCLKWHQRLCVESYHPTISTERRPRRTCCSCNRLASDERSVFPYKYNAS